MCCYQWEAYHNLAKRRGFTGSREWTLIRDPALTERYVKLGELPEDTLGHAYFRFLVDHDLAFPGEPHSVAEAGIWHDVTHVLGGYGVSPEEEVLVVSFIAGFSREDPFFWLFTITLQFHFAVQVSPYAKPKEGLVQPAKVLAAACWHQTVRQSLRKLRARPSIDR